LAKLGDFVKLGLQFMKNPFAHELGSWSGCGVVILIDKCINFAWMIPVITHVWLSHEEGLWTCASLSEDVIRLDVNGTYSNSLISPPPPPHFQLFALAQFFTRPECEKLLRAARISFASYGNACYARYPKFWKSIEKQKDDWRVRVSSKTRNRCKFQWKSTKIIDHSLSWSKKLEANRAVFKLSFEKPKPNRLPVRAWLHGEFQPGLNFQPG